MESTISAYYNPQMKINYNPDYCQSNPCAINKPLSQFNAFNSPNGCSSNGYNPSSYTLPRLDDPHLNNSKNFHSGSQSKMGQPQRSQPSTLQRSQLKPISGFVPAGQQAGQHTGQPNGRPANSACPSAYFGSLPGHQSANSQPAANQPASRTNRREIPRLPNMVIMNKLTSNPSQPSAPHSSTLPSASTLSAGQNPQRNALQSPAFDKSAINGLKAAGSKIQRPLSGNYSMIGQPTSSRSSPIMSASTKNQFAKPAGSLGSTSNLSVRSTRPSGGSRNSHSPPVDQQSEAPGQKQPRFGLNASKAHSLSKSNLNAGSTLNRSNLNLNLPPGHHTNTLPGPARPAGLKYSNLPANLSGSTTQLADAKRSSLIRQQKTSTSCLPAPKSRPTSALLPDGLNNGKSRSKLPNSSSNSRTSSSLNLNAEQTTQLVKPLGTMKATTKDSFNALKKRPAPSNSIKSTMQNLSQSSSNSIIYKPYSSLTGRSLSKPRMNAKDAKTSPGDGKDKHELDSIGKTADKFNKNEGLLNLKSQTNYRNAAPDKADQCNIARVSPIRRQYTMSSNIKRQLNGSLNSSDQDDELDDEIFDSENTLNQPTSEDSNSFNSEEARYYAVLSSSEDEKLIGGPRRSREREEKRLRRASGQRSGSSRRSSPKAAVGDAKDREKSKTSTPLQQNSDDKLTESTEPRPKQRKDEPAPPAPPNQSRKRSVSSLNKSNSSSINTIDHKSSTLTSKLEDMFPTLNRLHNSNSIQQLNALESPGKTPAGKTDEDYQSDDAELTLYKLKSLDFSCNSSANAEKSPDDKDGNNNSLNMSGANDNSTLTNFDTPPHGHLNDRLNNSQNSDGKQINGDCSNGEFGSALAAPGLSSLFSNYMNRSIGNLTGSLSKLNAGASNWSNGQPDRQSCSTPPLLPNFRSKSPNSGVISTSSAFQTILTPTFPMSQPYASLLSSPCTTNTVINNHVQNTTILNNVPSSFTSRLTKCGETRGSSLSLLSACSSNYSNNLSINSNQTYQSQPQRSSTSSALDKGALNEIKQLRSELNRANEKINLLKSQLVTSGQMVASFEQSLQTKTSRMKHYVLQLEEKNREIDNLKTVIEDLRKTYGFSLMDLNLTTVAYRTDSPGAFGGSNLNGSLNESLHHSRSLHNSSDGESAARSKSKPKDKKNAKKRSQSKKSRGNSAHSTDDEDTVSLASVHSKDGTLNGSSSGWFKSSFSRAFRKKSNRSKHGSNQELDKTGDLSDSRHPQHPSQLHQSYIKQDSFRQELYGNRDGELLELKAQLSEKEKCLTDERLRSLSREDELLKLKECLNCLQQELFSLRKQNLTRAD